jgi:CheY-like chemotaxis protein
MLLSQNGAKWVKPPCLEVSPTLRHTCHNASSVCDQVKRMALHTPVRILVIDDEPSIVHGLAQLLRREGYRVATAANGRHALAQLQVQPYDVILSDLHMPELDGQAFYALLRQQYPALCPRVIFFTGAASEATHRAFLAQCGQPWLRKPFSFAMLRRVLAQMLGEGPPASGAPGP